MKSVLIGLIVSVGLLAGCVGEQKEVKMCCPPDKQATHKATLCDNTDCNNPSMPKCCIDDRCQCFPPSEKIK